MFLKESAETLSAPGGKFLAVLERKQDPGNRPRKDDGRGKQGSGPGSAARFIRAGDSADPML